jgi:hypothetical protein
MPRQGHREEVPGYAFGSPQLARSPVTLADLEALKQAIGFGEEDHRALQSAWEVLQDQIDEVFDHWMGLFGPLFASYFNGPDGKPIGGYLHAAHARFTRWIEDTCTRPYDQAWLDYQHEIGLRHHRAKKNLTDEAESVPVVHLRYLVALLYPMSTIRHLLAAKGHNADEVDRMHQAWTKALVLHVALWSHPYVTDGDW